MQIKNILESNNVNVNKTNNNNVNNVREVGTIANRLVDKLNDPESHKFFCKVAWKLPERFIWVACEQALTGRNPKAYFTFLCNLELKKMGADGLMPPK